MSGSGATSVSGIRAPSASRRGDTRRVERWTGGGIAVHIIIMALAVLLWWIARDMVSVTQSLKDAGRVRFELSEDLRGEWRVFSQPSMPVSLEAAGPTKEINAFASQLEQTPGRFTYLYEITAADIANLQPDRRHLIQLTVDIRRFEATSEAVAPPELTVRPVVAGAGQSVFQVTLERYIDRTAGIDLGQFAKGQIQIQLKGSSKSRPYSYAAEARPANPLEVRGPASLVEAITDPNGLAKVKVSIDALQALKNFASVNAQSEEQVLQQGSLVSNMQLLPIEGAEVRERYKDERGEEQTRPVSFVNVRITYTPLQDFVQVSREFAVEVVLPNWLAQKSAHVENLPNNIQVDMKILGSQRPNFNEQNVHVRLDLSMLTRNELEIETVEGTNTRRAKVLNWYYSLDINTERLTYEFFNENVTAEQYLPIGEITIAWTE